MPYSDVEPMVDDEALTSRVKGCVLEQSNLKDVSTDGLAKYAMAQPDAVAAEFALFLAADPTLVQQHASGGQAAITDGAILSKVQYVWDDVKTVMNLQPVTA